MDENEIIIKAIKLFTEKQNDQPSQNDSFIVTKDRKDYVILRNINGMLAVYSITGDDYLRPLKKIPDWVDKI